MSASSNFYNNKRASKVFKAIQCRAGDNTLLQIHDNDAFQKGKAIALNSAEIKIVRINATTPSAEFSHKVISYLIKQNFFFNV